jgi:hypothetical protein
MEEQTLPVFTIDPQPEPATGFNLVRDGAFFAAFPSLEDAEKAKTIAETSSAKVPTGTWVDDGKGLEYPEGTDNYHSGPEKPLTFEQRFDAVLRHFRDVHGFHLPAHLAPAPLPSEAPPIPKE